MQQQNGSKDCGLFALAFAMSICSGQNPGSLGYIQYKLRSHLLSCLEKRYLTCFPTRCRARSCSGPSVEIRFPVFCSCRQPKDEGTMVECSLCKEWYHKECERIPEQVWTDVDYYWLCTKCKNKNKC